MACVDALARGDAGGGVWRGSGAENGAADAGAASWGECEGQCESYERESSRGRYLYISGECDGHVEYECDVVGEWNEWRVEHDRND